LKYKTNQNDFTKTLKDLLLFFESKNGLFSLLSSDLLINGLNGLDNPIQTINLCSNVHLLDVCFYDRYKEIRDIFPLDSDIMI